jgi:lysophospholipase L1-like esterase/dienelactone hydrolase
MSIRNWLLSLVFALVGLLPFVAVAQQSANVLPPIKIAMIGDSTMSSYANPPPDKPTLTGWGQVFGLYFHDSVQVLNHAASGRSSKSFLREGRWEPVLALKPSYVFIQFGHNDQPGKGDRTTDPDTDYQDNLKKYIDDARAIGCTPILVTPVARRTFQTGHAHTTLTPYADATKKVGQDKQVAVIDLHALSFELFDKLGDEASSTLTASASDRTHFSRHGAKEIARLVANSVSSNVPALAAYLLQAEAGTSLRSNMVGAYGPWLAADVLGDGPARLSFRLDKWKSVKEWQPAARARVLECMSPVNLGAQPEVRVDSTHEFDGLKIERLSWQLPGGPRSEAVLLKPANATGKLPGILALHDHGGNKFLGWRKITRIDDQPWQIVVDHQQRYYGGVAWANEIAKRGYAVLIHDTFLFASRRVRVSDVADRVKQNGVDPEPTDEEGIKRYNAFAASHENIMEKSLLSAGTTWPGVYVVEDQRALDVLCARPDVDAKRVGCCGLSGGGMRTVFLGGLDDRIRCAIAVGFMTTWREFLLDKCFTHTWMTYVPLLPRDLDFPEILAMRAPAATMVLNCNEDALYTVPEMRRADAIMRATFDKAGAADLYRCNFYSGGHKFDLEMQKDAFDWFDKHLK